MGHPIKDIVVEDVRPGVDEVRKNLLWSRFFFKFRNLIGFVKANDSKTGRIFNLPQTKGTN